LWRASASVIIPKAFSDHDKDTFITKAFDYMARFFEGSLQELKTRNPGTNTKFQKVDSRSFESIIYINGKQASKCGIWLGDFLGSKGSSSIMYSSSGLSQGNSQGNSFTERMSIKANGNILGLKSMRISHLHRMGISHLYRTEKILTNEGAAEYYWTRSLSFCRLLGLGCPKQAFAKIATPRKLMKPVDKITYCGQGFSAMA
jgi:hypothetical protein